jgi:hypothetical protein
MRDEADGADGADETGDDLFQQFERRALDDLPEDDTADDAELDLVRALAPAPSDASAGTGTPGSGQPGAPAADGETAPAADGEAAPAADLTLGGYIELHDRVPAFEGGDGMPYTVDVDVVPADGDGRRFAAFLIFIRWAATGAGIMDHVESGDVAWGDDEESARQAAYDLSLYEVRAELDAAIARRRANSEPGGTEP